MYGKLGLGYNFEITTCPILMCAVGGLFVGTIGVLVPPTMFWSEGEINTLAVPGTDLPHMLPQVKSWANKKALLIAEIACSHMYTVYISVRVLLGIEHVQ